MYPVMMVFLAMELSLRSQPTERVSIFDIHKHS